jgi:oligoribonuclease
MLIIFLDTETTGLDPFKHKIIEIAFKILQTPSLKEIDSYESFIQQPEEDLKRSDPESIKINGYNKIFNSRGKKPIDVGADIVTAFERHKLSEKGGFFLCQNPSFDRPFFQQLISVEQQKALKWPYHWLDLASMYWILYSEKITKESQISKNAIAQSLGLPKEADPHRAINGVQHLIDCYKKLTQSQLQESELPARFARGP